MFQLSIKRHNRQVKLCCDGVREPELKVVVVFM